MVVQYVVGPCKRLSERKWFQIVAKNKQTCKQTKNTTKNKKPRGYRGPFLRL